jgi:translation initiation factor IF-3
LKDKKRLNNDIIASKVQLIDDEQWNLWEMSFKEAQVIAADRWLDLMEIGKRDDVTLIKILDYGKFLYKQKKQDQKNKQRSKTPEMKTLKISFRIDGWDLEIRKKQAIWFAQDGHPLKVVLFMKWRENQHNELAREKIKAFVNTLSEYYKIDKDISQAGSNLIIMLKTIK